MLDDRYYMRQDSFSTRRSITVMILVVNAVAFLLQHLLYRFSRFPTDEYFALSMGGLAHGYIWQLLTFQVMHGGLMHLLLNGWVIYIFGKEVEETLGRKSFLTLYVSSGVLGGLVQCLSELVPGQVSGPVVGASAGAFGLTAAYALLFPDRILLLFFVIPLRAKYLLVLSGVIAVYGVIAPSGNIAHAAHLGGMLAGVFFVRYAVHWKWPQVIRATARTPTLVKVKAQTLAGWSAIKKTPPAELSPEEFLSKEVDPILDKISTHGIHSLTERERRILQAARDKMGQK
jgi:membrane associated rhomboid family serine protease